MSKFAKAKVKKLKASCVHPIKFNDIIDRLVVIRAIQGRSTKSIAKETGLSVAQAQYRITKAQNITGNKFRSEYRDCSTPIARKMNKATESIAENIVSRKVDPFFVE